MKTIRFDVYDDIENFARKLNLCELLTQLESRKDEPIIKELLDEVAA